MLRLRRHLSLLSSLALIAWLLAFVMASACLAQEPASRSYTKPISQFILPAHADGSEHSEHACIQHCADSNKVLVAANGLPGFDTPHLLTILILPALLLLALPGAVRSLAFLPREFHPAGPPARLMFVRLND
ncbi:hypothetical protein SAMN02745857_03819 [Andreprevotia lacus DSM 23236]|uniref:Copper resistance protein n=1 Tax=Andreprevotia lacus DSM 23236 TaxID=1121001 RepID=A0A1W1XZQ7_9NEIS|nr:hypothetical protein [Andreprevotia lacus]SMC29406.1 hypothetical protein SAMN02745857_03819 [Andreprevotia lacus DSM 23236]